MNRQPATERTALIAHCSRLLGMACLLLATVGCASFWDELMSNERDWNYAYSWRKPDPLVVLAKPSTDGVRRAQALSDLKEPLQNNGDAQKQDLVLNILSIAAKQDREPYCRLAAVRSLGKFHDPRAARILEEVYQLPSKPPEANKNDPNTLPFTPGLSAMIRKEALMALEMTRDKEARHLLIRVARQPGPAQNSDLTDRQQTQDEKTVAIRALGKYKEPECVEALKYVMRTEKDIALRHRALESLEEATNRKWPDKREDWQNDTVDPLPGVPGESAIQRAAAWIPKF